MSEICEVLMNDHADCLRFDVDTSGVDFITAAGGASPSYAMNGTGKNTFQKGDSFRLLSVGYILPESFTPYYNNAFALSGQLIAIQPRGVITGNTYYNPSWPSGQQFIPMENFETVCDTFFSCRDSYNTVTPTLNLLSENFRLNLYLAYAPYISMLGVPATLAGKRFWIRPFVKIIHTIPLV